MVQPDQDVLKTKVNIGREYGQGACPDSCAVASRVAGGDYRVVIFPGRIEVFKHRGIGNFKLGKVHVAAGEGEQGVNGDLDIVDGSRAFKLHGQLDIAWLGIPALGEMPRAGQAVLLQAYGVVQMACQNTRQVRVSLVFRQPGNLPGGNGIHHVGLVIVEVPIGKGLALRVGSHCAAEQQATVVAGISSDLSEIRTQSSVLLESSQASLSGIQHLSQSSLILGNILEKYRTQ